MTEEEKKRINAVMPPDRLVPAFINSVNLAVNHSGSVVMTMVYEEGEAAVVFGRFLIEQEMVVKLTSLLKEIENAANLPAD